MGLKVALVLLFCICFVGFGSAQQFSVNADSSMQYGFSLTINIDKDTPGTTRSIYGSLCGNNNILLKKGSKISGPNAPFEVKYPTTVDVKIPDEAACGYGSKTIDIRTRTLSGSTELDIGSPTFDVEEKGFMDNAHAAKNLVVSLNTDQKIMSDFFLTDNNIGGLSSISGAGILMDERNNGPFPDNTHAMQAGPGTGAGGSNFEPTMKGSGGELSDLTLATMSNGALLPIFNEQLPEVYDGSKMQNNKYIDSASTVSPLHEDGGSYALDGSSIRWGHFPEYYINDPGNTKQQGDQSDPGNNDPNFFVCRNGATMSNGDTQTGIVMNQTIYNSPDINHQLYKCIGGSWNQVDECSDDIDNDGDGKIDYGNDPSCNSPTDTESGLGCQTGVTRETVIGGSQEIVAQYMTSSGCSTNGPIAITDNIVARTLSKSPSKTSCVNGAITSPPCTSKSFDFAGFGYNILPVAKYWPTPNYFQQIETADTSLNLTSDVYKTDFVEDYEGWTYKVQSLHEAEKLYTDDTTSKSCGGKCQDFDNWEDRIKMPEVEQAYNNSDSSTNIQAWHSGSPNGPYNAGVNVSSSPLSQKEVMSKDSSVGAVFKGGFAGKCDSDEVWQKTKDTGNTWRCSGDIPWEQTVYLPEFDNDSNAGLIFPPYNFKNSQADLPNYIYEVKNRKQLGAGWDSFETAAEQMDFLFSGPTDVDGINARCWNGTKGLTEAQVHNSESYIKSNFNVNVTDWMNINVPSDPSEPVADYRPLEHEGSYSCYWNITTAGGEKISDIQDDTYEIHRHLGKSSPSSKKEIVVKNITEDSSYAGDLPDMTGTDHTWTESDLNSKISSWN